jgi:hypothetical protein
MGFFRSLASPVYAIGRIFSAFERGANVIDMYAEDLEAQTELQLVPKLTALQIARDTMRTNIAAGNVPTVDAAGNVVPKNGG